MVILQKFDYTPLGQKIKMTLKILFIIYKLIENEAEFCYKPDIDSQITYDVVSIILSSDDATRKIFSCNHQRRRGMPNFGDRII